MWPWWKTQEVCTWLITLTSAGLRKAVLLRLPLLISISLGKQFVLAVGQMNPLRNSPSLVRTADGCDEVELWGFVEICSIHLKNLAMDLPVSLSQA